MKHFYPVHVLCEVHKQVYRGDILSGRLENDLMQAADKSSSRIVPALRRRADMQIAPLEHRHCISPVSPAY